MQIEPRSSTQYNVSIPAITFKEIFNYVIWPLAAWFGGILYKRLKQFLNAVVTNNNNRIRDDVITAVSQIMATHESNAFIRLNGLEDSHASTKLRLDGIERQLTTLIELLNKTKEKP